MSDNIISLESYRRERLVDNMFSPAESDALGTLNDAFMDYLSVFSSNELMNDIHKRCGIRFKRIQMLETISEKACEVITKNGMEPSDFRIDPVVFEMFMTKEFKILDDKSEDEWIIPPEMYWNGPYYDWKQKDGTLIRAASTILHHHDGGVELLFDMVKMEKGSQQWLMLHDGCWEHDDFLEAVEVYLREKQDGLMPLFEDGWDDERDDDDSIENLCLPWRIVDALEQEGVTKITELCAMTEEELLEIWGIGGRSVEAIKEALEEEGLRLRE